ncbi:MAG: hypothetical protein J5885_04520 [Clostridia bacterium]|nr:hypothetical protein [Clostridia bacterium]
MQEAEEDFSQRNVLRKSAKFFSLLSGQQRFLIDFGIYHPQKRHKNIKMKNKIPFSELNICKTS